MVTVLDTGWHSMVITQQQGLWCQKVPVWIYILIMVKDHGLFIGQAGMDMLQLWTFYSQYVFHLLPLFMKRLLNTNYDIVQCAQFKLLSLFCFQDILTAMFTFFHIPFKLIARHVHTWSLFSAPFDIKIAYVLKVYLLHSLSRPQNHTH